MKEPFTPMKLAIVQLEALDILTASIIRAQITDSPATISGDLPPISLP